ncbi:hypothetical protein F5Y14DRAFT_437899 [Nemania sp. NC0429]|nr:hypothetical protein F5Y14DRAFT_437899 [Nemania sp. NC0429]
MYAFKLFLFLSLFAAGLILSFYKAAPVAPLYVASVFLDPASAFKYPWDYASSLCYIAAEFSASQLSGFASWGQLLFSYAATELPEYDALTGPLCKATGTPSGGNGASNGTATITAAPTSTGTSGGYPGTSITTSVVVTGLATKHTTMFAGAAGVAIMAAIALL